MPQELHLEGSPFLIKFPKATSSPTSVLIGEDLINSDKDTSGTIHQLKRLYESMIYNNKNPFTLSVFTKIILRNFLNCFDSI